MKNATLPAVTGGSNSSPVLADIATEINEHDEARRACEIKGVMHGLKVGELLLEAKKIVPHGEFSKWREEHTTVSQRMAQTYMTIARDPRITEDFIREYETVSHLTLQKAVQLTREPQEKTLQELTADIKEAWKRNQTIIRKMASVLDGVRAKFQEYGGDEQFLNWMFKEARWPQAMAQRLLPAKGEAFDADELGDAFLEHLANAAEVGDRSFVETPA